MYPFLLQTCGSQYTSLQKSADVPDAQIITFATRGDAARFYHSNPTIPKVGKLDVAWVESAGGSAPAAVTTAKGSDATAPHTTEEAMEDPITDENIDIGEYQNQYDAYDMAEDDDGRWN